MDGTVLVKRFGSLHIDSFFLAEEVSLTQEGEKAYEKENGGFNFYHDNQSDTGEYW